MQKERRSAHPSTVAADRMTIRYRSRRPPVWSCGPVCAILPIRDVGSATRSPFPAQATLHWTVGSRYLATRTAQKAACGGEPAFFLLPPTPADKAMFQMMRVFAEFERSMIREWVNAGIARAADKHCGRPFIDTKLEGASVMLWLQPVAQVCTRSPSSSALARAR